MHGPCHLNHMAHYGENCFPKGTLFPGERAWILGSMGNLALHHTSNLGEEKVGGK